MASFKPKSEVRQREEFFKVHSSYIPRDILASMGLYDTPNSVINIAALDTNLLNIDISDPDQFAGCNNLNRMNSYSLVHIGSIFATHFHGTITVNNDKLLKDDPYNGLRQPRATGHLRKMG